MLFPRCAQAAAASTLFALMAQEALSAQDVLIAEADTSAAAATSTVVISGARTVAPPSASTKLPLSKRETPQSLSAIDISRLETESILNINDAMYNVTGVNVTFYDSQRPLYYARGFQITDFQIDGIPSYSSNTNQEFDTALYERIEVVRGANGLLSGAGIPSATVNLIRKRPHKTFEASVAATTGSWQYRRMVGDLNVPLAEDGRWRARVVAAWQDRDSFRDRYREDKLAYLAAIEADLTRNTTVTLGYQNQDNNPEGAIWGTIPRFASDGSLAKLPRNLTFSPSWTRWGRESGTAYLTLDQQLGDDWRLKAAFNRTEGSVQSLRVYASGFPNLSNGTGMKLLAGVGDTDETQDSVDLYVNGKLNLLGRMHDIVLGYNGSKLKSTTNVLSSVANWSYTIPDLRKWNGEGVAPPVYSRTGAWRVATTEQSGVYASARWRVADAWSIVTGARLSQWETSTANFSTAGAFTGTTGAYKVENEVTPYVGVIFDVSKDISLYASHTGVFKPQNYKDKANNLLAPVDGKNTELGLKAELLDKKLSASFAIYRALQNNYAVLDSSLPLNSLPDGSSAYKGVNGTQSKGYEFDVSGQLRPGWTINAGYSNNRIERQANDLIYANLPRHSVQLSTSVQLPGELSRVTVGGGVNWQSKVLGFNIPHPTLGTVTVQQDAYALVNLHANYRISDQWSAQLAVRNALDENYWANLDYPNVGEPRSWSLTLRYRY